MKMHSVYLFISPHLDDAVLSCGGRICQLCSADERVIVATVITADAPAGTPRSRLVRRCHSQWGMGDRPFEFRCYEDEIAVKRLGAEKIHMGLLDAIYRCNAAGHPLYNSDTVEIPVHSEDWATFEPMVRKSLLSLIQSFEVPPAKIFCPLGIGGHVDHLIVRRALEEISDPSMLEYYEEFPYVTRTNAARNWVKKEKTLNSWLTKAVTLSENEIQARVDAISCYETQIPFLFPTFLEGWQEVFTEYFPFLGRLLPWKPEREDTCRRMAQLLRAYIAEKGGEQYWSQIGRNY